MHPTAARKKIPDDVAIQIRVQKELRRQLHLLAAFRGIPLTQFLRTIALEEIDRVIETSTDADLVTELRDLRQQSTSKRTANSIAISQQKEDQAA